MIITKNYPISMSSGIETPPAIRRVRFKPLGPFFLLVLLAFVSSPFFLLSSFLLLYLLLLLLLAPSLPHPDPQWQWIETPFHLPRFQSTDQSLPTSDTILHSPSSHSLVLLSNSHSTPFDHPHPIHT